MVRIHSGPPLIAAQSARHHAPVDHWQIAAPTLRRQAGQNRPGAPLQQRSRSSMYRAPRFERGGCRRNWRSGACAVSAPRLQEGAVAPRIPAASTTHFSRRSPMQRHRFQKPKSAGANPAAGTTFAPVAQRRGSGLKPRPVSVRVRPGALPLNARVAQ